MFGDEFTERVMAIRMQMEACERGEIIMTDEDIIAAGEEIDRIARERDEWVMDLRAIYREAAE